MAHITGGGITENLPRVLPKGTGAIVEINSWPVPPIFEHLQKIGNVPQDEMLRTFNMGIGMILVVPAEKVQEGADHPGALRRKGLHHRPHREGREARHVFVKQLSAISYQLSLIKFPRERCLFPETDFGVGGLPPVSAGCAVTTFGITPVPSSAIGVRPPVAPSWISNSPVTKFPSSKLLLRAANMCSQSREKQEFCKLVFVFAATTWVVRCNSFDFPRRAIKNSTRHDASHR